MLLPIPVPAAGSVSGPRPQLTLGMTTYDDYDGAYFTAAALRLYHPEVTDRTEILVVDNNPCGPAAWPLKKLEDDVARLRYLPVDDISSPAVKDRVVREAHGDWVLIVDSHVLIAPGAIARLLDFIDAQPESDDLLQGPLLHQGGHFPEQQAEWQGTLFGHWPRDRKIPGRPDPDAPPVEIGQQGLGLFACRRASWPGYSPLFRGHGAEEGYLHERYRALGRRVLCLPFLAWEHRFGRALSVPYHPTFDDRIRNYLVAFEEIGWPVQDVVDQFNSSAGVATTARVVAAWAQEKRSALACFPTIAVLDPERDDTAWQAMHDQMAELGVANRLRRIVRPRDSAAPDSAASGSAASGSAASGSAAPDPAEAMVARALDHRHLLGRATTEEWASLLVLDVHDRLRVEVEADIRAATPAGWSVAEVPLAPIGAGGGARVALAYHRSSYPAALAALPADPAALHTALADSDGSLMNLLRAGSSAAPIGGPVRSDRELVPHLGGARP